MENLPQIDPAVRNTMVIKTPDYWMDHQFLGQPVLPAVEALELLARAAREIDPQCRVAKIRNARFDKFLFMDPAKDQITAAADLHAPDNGALRAALITRTKSAKAAITRTKTHAKLDFDQSDPVFHPTPLDVAAAAEGICTFVDSEKIYQQLVPFGPAFRNIIAPLCISPNGALAKIGTPDIDTQSVNLLGSPFALDAAFHAACVWAQRFMKVVAFPVAIDQRIVVKPCLPNRVYYGRILPRQFVSDLMCFDIWLLDENGHLCEMVQGVQMRDVSGGRLQPPAWIMKPDGSDPLRNLRQHCQALKVIELDAVAPFALHIFTDAEQWRYTKMGDKRRKSFLAGRLALKRLFRECHDDTFDIQPHEVETLCRDDSGPRCRHKTQASTANCSLSHDGRFAIAVADTNAIGIDVEEITGKAFKCRRIYMHPEEQDLVLKSELGAHQAAVRIWSIKEAVSKATDDMLLAEAWHRVRVTEVGETATRFCLNNQVRCVGRHATLHDHLITLCTFPG